MSKEKFDELINKIKGINDCSAETMNKIFNYKHELSTEEYNEVMSLLISVYINGILCQHVLLSKDEDKDEELIDTLGLSIKMLAPKMREAARNLLAT